MDYVYGINKDFPENFRKGHLTLKKAGRGGSYVLAAQEIACHFSQDHARILTLLDFFKNDVGPRVKESF